MKAKQYVLIAIAWIVAAICGYYIGKNFSERPPCAIKETRETFVDTIHYFAPISQSEAALGAERYTIPTRFICGGAGGEPRQRGECDSVGIIPGLTNVGSDSSTIELPTIQRHYADSTYEAWVSGPINPRLDSIKVFATTTLITKEIWKPPKRWHLGVTAGYGYGTKGFQPYVGIGITYSLFSF